VLSSFLSYYSITAVSQSTSALLARRLSIILHCIGKIAASINAIWIIILCLFQFSNFYNQCYCISCVISKGMNAFNLISLGNLSGMKIAWIGGVYLASGCAIVFVVFVYVFINPQPSMNHSYLIGLCIKRSSPFVIIVIVLKCDVVCAYRQQAILGLTRHPPHMFQGSPNKQLIKMGYVLYTFLFHYHHELKHVSFLFMQASITISYLQWIWGWFS
jgi:hypothetical protein